MPFDAVCRGNRFDFKLDEETSKGLYAVMAGHPEWVTPEMFAEGQYIWSWFFSTVQGLAMDYNKALGIKKAG
jgi:hypothetical protein